MVRIFLIAGFLIGAFPAFAFAGEADSLRWYFQGQRQMRDGGIEAHFSLYGADALEIDELEFFYTTGSLALSKNPNDQAGRRSTAYYKKVPTETRNLVIYSGHYAQLELLAVAKADGMTYVTQTTVSLYGQSGIDKTDFEEIDALPALAGLDIRRRGFYGVMTGEPIDFSMRNGYTGPVRIYLDGEKIAELLPEDGIYSYLLPGGRKLATRARSDYHELLFVADAFEAEGFDGVIQFSCRLPMYRSARDNQDFPGGIATLCFAAVLSAVAVVLKGRRFKWR
ncbi:MAG: hypothetical protein FWF13_06390 [Acidobacteria bacterium]|nr:hypothetical protein [Acidobacteriota bacterium]